MAFATAAAALISTSPPSHGCDDVGRGSAPAFRASGHIGPGIEDGTDRMAGLVNIVQAFLPRIGQRHCYDASE